MTKQPETAVREDPKVAEPELRTDTSAHLPMAVPPKNFPRDVVVPAARLQTGAVGQRVTRLDARLHGLGQTKYIADLAFPGMLHARIKRAGIASARIKRIDTSAAETLPGVVAVVTGRDFAINSFGPSVQDQPVLADERVFHAGDGVAAVAAITEEVAEEAVARITVEYEPLPAVFDPIEAMEDSAPLVHPPASNIYAHRRIVKGDVEAGLRDAAHLFTRQLRTQMIEHAPIEPHAAIADWDANGRLTVWTTLGRTYLGRGDLARVLGLSLNRIRVVGTSVGGNFGGKNEITHEPVLAVLSKKAGRPVKGVFTRRDEFIATTTRHPAIMDYTTGVAADGWIIARKVRLVLDGGAYCSWSETTLGKACILAAGPYQIPNLMIEAFAVYTNKTMTGAMRGFGAPQVCFGYESQMDDIAYALGIDPLRIRLLNAFGEGAESPTGQLLQGVVVKNTLVEAAERFGWQETPE